jgi:hypothetical protein
MKVTLTQPEVEALFQQHPDTAQDGGFQSLLVSLQSKLNSATSEIELDRDDLERIPKYAFDYKNGGWQTRLLRIFGSSLGPALGR